MTEVPCRTTPEGLTVVLPLTISVVDPSFIKDTGAAVTIVQSHFYNSTPAIAQPKLKEPGVTRLTVADDGRMQTEGVATLTFRQMDSSLHGTCMWHLLRRMGAC